MRVPLGRVWPVESLRSEVQIRVPEAVYVRRCTQLLYGNKLTRDGRVEALRLLHEAVQLAQLVDTLLPEVDVTIVVDSVAISAANLFDLVTEDLEVLRASDKLKNGVGDGHGAGVDGSEGH